MKRKLNLLIIGDNSVFNEGLGFFLEYKLRHRVAGILKGDHIIYTNTYLNNSDIILLIMDIPTSNYYEYVKQALSKNRELNYVAITPCEAQVCLSKLISSGFKGCILKDRVYDELKIAIEVILKGDLYFPDSMEIRKKNHF